ncbi:putative F-box only protein [Helianthus annuus]|nr:putative F-box only protein [Helianthus annuus]KAJ0936722.1 putative F-box only protein [Helianthus annuus]
MNNRSIHNSVPTDIAFKIASLLQELDLCALGSCSRFWRELCGSDHIWSGLCIDRWPALGFDKGQSYDVVPEFNPHHLQQQHLDSNLKGWRGFYVNKHHEMASKADAVIAFLEQCISSESIEVNHYLVAMQNMHSMQFGFRDVVLFFFKENLHVLLNLAGMHYCIAWLGVPAERVMEALYRSKISDRKICVQWWKLGRWSYGFRLRDESISRRASLRDLAMTKEQEVLDVLYRGAIHEVIRVQISAPKPVSSHWSCQSQIAGTSE